MAYIVEVIHYTESDAPGLGEIFDTFDSMLGWVRVTIRQRETSLEFNTTHLWPIIQRIWVRMNIPLHMGAYALNPKWYVESLGEFLPLMTPLRPSIQHRWDHMNTPLHLVAYALNPKWCGKAWESSSHWWSRGKEWFSRCNCKNAKWGGRGKTSKTICSICRS